MVLKKGLGAEALAWSLTFLLLPLCCVYYPVSVLPDWLEPIALALPPTHVFEGLRSLILDGVFDGWAMVTALALNLLYLTAAATTFALLMRSARSSGSLLQTGE
jgi:ABC-2 type transport system permease protein